MKRSDGVLGKATDKSSLNNPRSPARAGVASSIQQRYRHSPCNANPPQ
jgi:hypothetical protein